MKRYCILAAVLFSIMSGLKGAAQSGGQAAGQSQAKAKPATPAQPAAKPADKANEQGEAIPPAGPNALFPAVVARVNGKSLLGRDLEQRVRGELAGIGNPSWKDLRDDYKKEVTSRQLSQLVGDELLYQKAVAGGVTATPAEVQAEFDKIAKTYANDAALNSELAGRGMDRNSLSREIAKNLVVQKYIQENISKKIVITPAEVANYYNSHLDDFKHPDLIRTSHILISVPQGATPEQDKLARQRAEALLERVKKGEDFAKLAKENSMDPSASQGGDIGMTESGVLETPYELAAAQLKVGEISGIVKTSYGYHIIKLTDRKKAGTATLEEVRSQLSDFLKGQKEDEEVAKLVKTLQSQGKVEILVKLS